MIPLDAFVSVVFEPNEKGNPAGQLATAYLVFTAGVLAGLKLQGFGIWERRGSKARNLTLPARQYSINGERRSFALLRPTTIESVVSTETFRLAILDAYTKFEESHQS